MAKHSLGHSPARAIAASFLLMGAFSGCALLAREATVAYLSAKAEFSAKTVEIEINRSFLERYKNRVGITTTFTVDKAMQNPVARFLDGDLHIAGRAPEIGLPVVAEIANAASETEATDLVHGAAGTGRPLRISGVWRIWPEHAGSAIEEQGTPLPAAESDHPSHVFEIHPVTRINNLEILDSFRPVEGFLPGDARATFEIYEKVACTLTVEPRTVSIVTQTGLFNNVEFVMEIIDGRQIEGAGGRFVIASVRDLKGNLLVPRLRMVFAKGTPPERAVRRLKQGDRLHVNGLPRVDLAEVSRRVRGGQEDPSLLRRTLPYEIIIVGIYRDGPTHTRK